MSKLYHIKERTLDVQNQDGRLLLKLLETQKFYAAGLLLNQWKPINLTYTDSNGNTALHLAAKNNQEGLIQLLVMMGAELQLRNNEMQTPVDIAKSHGSKSIIAYFEKVTRLDNSIAIKAADSGSVQMHVVKEHKMKESKKLEKSIASVDLLKDLSKSSSSELTEEDFGVAGAISGEE